MRIIALLFLLCYNINAAELPDGGDELLGERQLNYSGAKHGSGGRADGVYHISSTQLGNFWNVQLISALEGPLKKGSLVALRFEARCTKSADESGCGWMTPYLQRNGAPYNKFINQRLSIPRTWKTFILAGYADDNYKNDGFALGFGAGQAIQSIEIRNISVQNYADSKKIADIPLTKSSYQGREANAPWRKTANDRIEKLRKGQLSVQLLDADGKPIANKQVTLKMQRHAFPFGAAMNPWRLVGDSEDDKQYQKHVLAYFNAGTFENALKWGAWSEGWNKKNWNKPQTVKALEWCKAHDIPMRGHVIVWPSWKHLPKSLKAQQNNPDAIKQAVNQHIDEITTATGDLLTEWDVVNEPFTNHDLMDICGNEVMLDWFQRMRQRLPKTALAINDYGIITVPFDDAHVEHYYKTISYLIENDAPLDVIGIQGHFSGYPPSMDRILSQLDRFAKLGLKIRITEFDIDTLDEDLQADFTRDLYTAAFSHPSVIGVQNWGFWAKAHWRPRAAMFRADWTPKPNALAYKQLIYADWWSEETKQSDADGMVSCSAFYGSYLIEIEGGHTKTIDHLPMQELQTLVIP